MVLKRTEKPIPPQLPELSIVKLREKTFCIVDPDDLPWIAKLDWRLVRSNCRSYAVRRYRWNGKTIYIRMHREILNAPKDMEVHHINGNTLDNRKVNLMLLTPEAHAQINHVI